MYVTAVSPILTPLPQVKIFCENLDPVAGSDRASASAPIYVTAFAGAFTPLAHQGSLAIAPSGQKFLRNFRPGRGLRLRLALVDALWFEDQTLL